MPILHAQVLVPRGSEWRYRKGTTEASDPRGAWREQDFDASAWPLGNAPFGYGDAPFGTELPDMRHTYPSVFLRKTFTVSALPPEARLRIEVDYDDGYILWINGERVSDRNEPDGEPLHTSQAAADHESGAYETRELPDPGDYLEPGENVIAVQMFNAGVDSSDCKFDVELSSYRKVADTTFSRDRGFCDAGFYVTIGTATPDATIRYTTDGTVPTDSHGTAANGQAVVHITTTTCLRAAAFKAEHEPTDVDTQTYIFTAGVIRQPPDPAGYPNRWRSVNLETDVPAEYDMDPEVVDDPAYSGSIEGDLKSLPALSIVCDPDEMFDRYQGIYPNAVGVGSEWERAVSAELIHPDGTDGFQIDCGIKISGAGFRYFHRTMKKSFSLMFKSEFGPSKLSYPLFPDSPVDSFDNLCLRSCGNDSFAYVPERGQFLRDAWGRRTQRDMGWMAAHGRFVHLYINGLYWGLYNVHERIRQNTLAQTYGGEEEDYDVLGGLGRQEPYYAAKAGTTHAFAETLRVRDKDLAVPANYAEMSEWLDIPQFIDYMIICMYQPHSDWDYYYSPVWTFNNIRFACRRSPTGGPPLVPFQFFIWDIEDSMEVDSIGTDVSATRGPWAIHENLMANGDYRVLFGDRAHKHLFHGGALTPEAAKARYSELAGIIYRAVVPESARWGDTLIGDRGSHWSVPLWDDYLSRTGGGTLSDYHPRTRDDEWIPERDRLLNEFLHNREAPVLSQLRVRGLYPNSVVAPVFHQHGGAIAAGFRLTMSTPAYTIYYVTGDADPRAPGGAIAPEAERYTGPVALTRTTHVRARVRKSVGTWSALNAATFNYTAHYGKIRITEIMYSPLGGREYEFVEIENTGLSTRGLSELRLAGATYSFPPGATLDAGRFAVIVADETAFASRYPGVKDSPGVQFFGVCKGRLDNGGERLALVDCDGATVTSVRYNDKHPWPREADGAGFSLVAGDAAGDQDDPATWRASNLIGGSPGRDDGLPYRVVINEALTHTDPPQVDAIELYNGGPVAADIGGWYISDSRDDYRKYRIPDGPPLAAGGHAVFDETAFNADTNDPSCFALDSHGEAVYLTQWDAAGNLLYLAEARFGGAANGVAFARHVTSDGDADFVAQSTPTTLGSSNAYPRVGPVVINELMYNPADLSNLSEEFIELVNISDSAVPLHDPAAPTNTWRLDAAVEYAFPAGTTLAAGEYALVVPTNEAAFRAAYPDVPAGVRIFGPYAGRLNNGGESVKLWRPDTPDAEGTPWILIDCVKYNDNSPWPENADGDGHSLERLDPIAYGNDPANWTAGLGAGGTPGTANSGALVSRTAGWRYHDKGIDLGSAWRATAYGDGDWEDGNAPLGYAYPEVGTTVSHGDNPAEKHITTYFRKMFTLGVTPSGITALTLRARYDDGFVAYLNGQEVARGSISGSVTYNTTAAGHAADAWETFNIDTHADRLVRGLNVLAVETHQSDAGSSDLFMDMELACRIGQSEQPDIAVSATALDVSVAQYGSAALSFDVWNSGGGTLDYTIVENTSHYSVSPTSGSSSGPGDRRTHTVTINTSVPIGRYARTIEVHDNAGSSNDTVVLTVNITVNAAGQASEPWTAYHDLGWLSGQPTQNITTGAAGTVELVRHDTGAGAGVMLANSYAGNVADDVLGAPAQGTDAHGVFDGIVDCNGFVYAKTAPITLTFSGLETNGAYEVVVFGNRAGGYLDRLSTVTIAGAAAFENASTAGADFDGAADPSVTICSGENTLDGYVARFRAVAPGADGEFTLMLDGGGSTAYFNALALRREGGIPGDNDGDGMTDAWEQEVFLSTSSPDSAPDADPDGDGYSNFEEFVAGTGALDGQDVFSVDLACSGGELVVSFQTRAAQGTGYEGLTRHYSLEEQAGGPAGAWATVPGCENIVGSGQAVSHIPDTAQAQRAYRAKTWVE
ncbi:MAG: lamin tail domain-containing protein [Kiritimatiellae bacterium]|nr:lamin tail domain-containing protein [Kiritimatiellia bacterium]